MPVQLWSEATAAIVKPPTAIWRGHTHQYARNFEWNIAFFVPDMRDLCLRQQNDLARKHVLHLMHCICLRQRNDAGPESTFFPPCACAQRRGGCDFNSCAQNQPTILSWPLWKRTHFLVSRGQTTTYKERTIVYSSTEPVTPVVSWSTLNTTKVGVSGSNLGMEISIF